MTYSVNIMVDYIQADVFTSVEGWLLLLLIILLLLETSTHYFVAFVAFNSTLPYVNCRHIDVGVTQLLHVANTSRMLPAAEREDRIK